MNINNKTYLTVLIIVLALFTIVNFSSCDDGPTEPTVEPGRRDYIWEVDTIGSDLSGLVSLSAIWGESPNNVWAGGTASTFKNTLWHYDGVKWERYILSNAISISDFYGIDRNNIWAAADNSIWHFNGGSWNEYTKLEYPEFDIVALNSIDGFSNNEIYAVGLAENLGNGTRMQVCLKYDGYKWDFLSIPAWNALLPQVKTDSKLGFVFIDAFRLDTFDMPSHQYILQGNVLKEILRSPNNLSLGKINGRVYSVDGRKIYKYTAGKMKLVINLKETNYAGRIWGRSEKDFFGVTWDFTIAHFNGTDLQNILQLNQDYYVNEAIIFDEEVFFLYENTSTGKAFILHGILE